MNNTPYATLTPSLILDAIESIGFRCSGSLFALNSYENRVYQVGIEENLPLIAKFYRAHRWSDAAILEEHQFSIELAEREIPVIAPLSNASGQTLHHYQGFRFALFPRQGGRTLELDNLEHLEWMGRFIGRLHAVGACGYYQHRFKLTPKTYGYDCYHYLIQHDFIPSYLKDQYCVTIEALLKKIEQRFSQIENIRYIRLHGDCHPGNVLWHDAGPRIVDLDDSLMGPAIQDLWMLLSGDAHQKSVELDVILRGYQEFFDFDYRELSLIEAMRSLRMIMYSSWLAKRWEDPAFPLNFPWFNTPHYWESHCRDLRDQLYQLEENEE